MNNSTLVYPNWFILEIFAINVKFAVKKKECKELILDKYNPYLQQFQLKDSMWYSFRLHTKEHKQNESSN